MVPCCAVGLPGGPGLLCKMMMPSGSGHYSAPSPCCTTYWSPVMRRRLLDWMCRTTSSWADKKEVCETWSPSRIVCCEMRNPNILLHDRCAGRKQEEHTFKKACNFSVRLVIKLGGVRACLICWWTARDSASVNTKSCHHAASWTWYQSHSAYLWDCELCHMNMILPWSKQ